MLKLGCFWRKRKKARNKKLDEHWAKIKAHIEENKRLMKSVW